MNFKKISFVLWKYFEIFLHVFSSNIAFVIFLKNLRISPLSSNIYAETIIETKKLKIPFAILSAPCAY